MRARIVNIIVTPQIVVDDGENLLPHKVEPLVVNWRDWAKFSERGLQDALAQLQAQLDAQSTPPTAPP